MIDGCVGKVNETPAAEQTSVVPRKPIEYKDKAEAAAAFRDLLQSVVHNP